MTTQPDMILNHGLFSTTPRQGHDFTPDALDFRVQPIRPYDLDEIKEAFTRNQNEWNWFYNYGDSPYYMTGKEAHCWLIATTHPHRGTKETENKYVVEQITASMIQDRLTMDQAQPFLNWLDGMRDHNYHRNIFHKTYALLARLVDNQKLYAHLRANHAFDSYLLHILPYFDATVSETILKELWDYVEDNLPNPNYWGWQDILIVMEYHADGDFVSRYLNTCPLGRDSIREALLTRHLPYEEYKEVVHTKKLVPFVSALFKHHLCAFGFQDFDLLLEHLHNGYTDLKSVPYRIHHEAITELMFERVKDEKEHSRLAYRWLRSEGANAIVGALECHDHKVYGDTARYVIQHYIQKGLGDLVSTLAKDMGKEAQAYVSQIRVELERDDEHIKVPEWFSYWAKRGIRLNKRGAHVHIVLPPLCTIDGQWLNTSLKHSIVRLLQDHTKVRAQHTLPKLDQWLDEPSRQRLVDYFNETWVKSGYRRDLQWCFTVQRHIHNEHMFEHIPTLLKSIRDGIEAARWDFTIRNILEEARKLISNTLLDMNTPEADFWVFWSAATLDQDTLRQIHALWEENKENSEYLALRRLEIALTRRFELEEIKELVKTYVTLTNNTTYDHNAQQWMDDITQHPHKTQWRSQFLWVVEQNDQHTLFRIDHDGSTVNEHDEDVVLQPDAKIRLAQTTDVSDDSQRDWARAFVDHDIALLHDIFAPEPQNSYEDDIPF